MSTGSRDPDLFTPEDNTPDIGLDTDYLRWSEQLRLDAIEAQELEHDTEQATRNYDR